MMNKHLNFFFGITFLIVACNNPDGDQPSNSADLPVDTSSVKDNPFAAVSAVFETDPVAAGTEDDAADDPAVWVHPQDPLKSLIFGSDKKKGLDVFDLSGKRLHTYEIGRINNVDVRQNVLGGIDIVAGSNRSTNAIDVWQVLDESGQLQYLGKIASGLPDVYGFCLYHNQESNMTYALINSKTGRVEQWLLTMESDQVEGQMLRELDLGRQVEGMVADDENGVLYVGVEEAGVYRFDAGATQSTEPNFLSMTSQENDMIAYDVEGLALFQSETGLGYLIVSSQGNDSYAVFDRSKDHRYLGSFKVVDGAVDGAEETDGIEALSGNFGNAFPEGLFICQDGYNFEGDEKTAQNFKVVSWKDIRLALDL